MYTHMYTCLCVCMCIYIHTHTHPKSSPQSRNKTSQTKSLLPTHSNRKNFREAFEFVGFRILLTGVPASFGASGLLMRLRLGRSTSRPSFRATFQRVDFCGFGFGGSRLYSRGPAFGPLGREVGFVLELGLQGPTTGFQYQDFCLSIVGAREIEI